MTIQRQYSLPNCKLMLEGLTNDNPMDAATARPMISMVTNVECHLSAVDNPLVGGREFLESLARTVSEYAQDYLSGIPHTARRDRRDPMTTVQLHSVGKNLHRLSVQPQSGNGDQAAFPPATEIDLTTVQLFDLVEAIDQLFADAQTLPELSLNLAPLPKRFVVSQEPIRKRAVPAALGVSGLAVAAAALFFLPIPEVRRPDTATDPATQESPSTSATPSPAGNSPETPPPDATNPSPEATVSPSPTDRQDAEGSSSASPSATSEDLEALLQSSRNISDPVELERLTADLQNTLYTGWLDKPAPSFTEPLEYRVGVDENGKIIGYRFANDPAATYLEEIPLSDVQFAASTPDSSDPSATPTEPDQASSDQTSIAQFLVVFRPEGVLEISPWYGLPPGESPSEESPEESTDSTFDSPDSVDEPVDAEPIEEP